MHDEPTLSVDASCSPGRTEIRLSVALLACYSPFVFLHLSNLWQYRPHYQFFPLVLAVFAWLLWQRWPRGGVEHTRVTRWLAWLLLWAGTTLLAAAVVLYSPWVGAVACVITVGGVMVYLAGRTALAELAPVWLLLWTTIPPPWRMDGDFIRVLQTTVSRSTSVLLDWVHIDHVLAGNVFELVGRQLFVAEACSGVNSQLVLITISVVLVIVFRRPVLHALLLVVAAIFWSTVVNIGRVALIVVAAARWDIDLSGGWQHQTLGFGLALAGLGLLLSTDSLLAGLLGPVFNYRRRRGFPDRDRLPLATDHLSRLWNRIVAMAAATEPAAASDEKTPEAASGGFLWLGLPMITCGVLGILQLVVLAVPGSPALRGDLLAGSIGADWLPEQIDGWQFVEFKTEEREVSSDEGHYSKTWSYHCDDQSLQVSVDFPFVGWHELTRCYDSTGWAIEGRDVRQDTDDGPFVEAVMTKPSGEAGFLLFSAFDGAVEPVQPRISHYRGVREKLARSPLLVLLGVADRSVSPTLTTIQIQQFFPTAYRLDEEQRQEATEVYLRLRRQLISQLWRNAAE